MPSWGHILQELVASAAVNNGIPNFDLVRRSYLSRLHQITGRNVIIYASAWLENKPNVAPEVLSIGGGDVQGFMEAVHGLTGSSLDLILHSPGGEVEAAEALVTYLRSKFDDIRVVVPGTAMSAATMIACAANRVMMGTHSFLGPIDPQFVVATPLGSRLIAAYAMLEQFELAKRECQDPSRLAAWLPMLNQYGPDLLVKCRLANDLAEELVTGWLERYMFAAVADGAQRARRLAEWLADHGEMKTHGRRLSRSALEAHGMTIEPLEADQQVQDAVLSVFHATTHMLVGSATAKLIENHLGRAFMRQVVMQFQPIGAPPPFGAFAPMPTPVSPQPPTEPQ